jgi:hypothetical protein
MCRILVLGLFAVLVACGQRTDPQELERLRQEKAALEAETERLRTEIRRLRGQPESLSAVAQFFANDARAGTLAGLTPGDSIDKARRLFGRETRMNVYAGSQRESQYEWELVGGITVRLSADDSGRIFRIGIVVDTTQPPVIATLEGITIGKDTFFDTDKRFGQPLWTNLHIWGVNSIYTVAQTLPRGEGRAWQLQLAYEVPKELSAEQLERIRVEVGKNRNVGYLMQFVGDRLPYLIVLEEPR